jgi:hypothetical protein
MKSEIPIAAIKGRALPVTFLPPFSPYCLLIAELNQTPSTANLSRRCGHVSFVPILLQKSAATDGLFGHFAKDDRL